MYTGRKCVSLCNVYAPFIVTFLLVFLVIVVSMYTNKMYFEEVWYVIFSAVVVLKVHNENVCDNVCSTFKQRLFYNYTSVVGFIYTTQCLRTVYYYFYSYCIIYVHGKNIYESVFFNGYVQFIVFFYRHYSVYLYGENVCKFRQCLPTVYCYCICYSYSHFSIYEQGRNYEM